MRSYFETEFVIDYRTSRSQMISKLLDKCEKIVNQEIISNISNEYVKEACILEGAKKNLKTLIISNHKTKLPWSDCELQEALSIIIDDISHNE